MFFTRQDAVRSACQRCFEIAARLTYSLDHDLRHYAAMVISRAVVATPIGDMVALDSGDGLCALEFTGPEPRLAGLEARLHRWFPPHEMVDRDTPTISRAKEWLAAYFAGTHAEIAGLPLDLRGARFEKRVWQALCRIAPGETTSYGSIAAALGSPGAARAVGAANGANPVAIIVPCHRVIGSSGALTGYGGGLDRKIWLLEHERRWSREGQLFLCPSPTPSALLPADGPRRTRDTAEGRKRSSGRRQ
jgi:methylated-DNA-[protein]-cysteine S-methyltransferase